MKWGGWSGGCVSLVSKIRGDIGMVQGGAGGSICVALTFLCPRESGVHWGSLGEALLGTGLGSRGGWWSHVSVCAWKGL